MTFFYYFFTVTFVAKMNSSGDWQWGIPIECSCTTYGYDIDLDSNGNSYVSIPTLRIDYILHSQKYESYNYKKLKYKFSDHYPISCDILIP